MKDNPRRRQEFETVEFGQDDDEIETITLQLHHSHLPQLDDADFIDWNQRTEMVIKGEKFEEIRPLLELMDTHEDELPGDWP